MASKQTYECFICKRNGVPDTRVYLDGKTEDGKTIYKNEDMSPHQHKQSSDKSSNEVVTTSYTASKENKIVTMLNDLNIKMNHVIRLLEETKIAVVGDSSTLK